MCVERGMVINNVLSNWFSCLPNSIAIILLLISGSCGVMFLIILNTIVQEKGVVVGNGKTIAIQNFFENILMFSGAMFYDLALKMDVTIPIILVVLAIIY